MKPLIGITTGKKQLETGMFYTLGELYCEKVRQAGGIPVILPWLPEDAKELLSHLDGLLISGGEDVDPANYHEEVIEACGTFHPEHDEAEFAFLAAAQELDMPVLGICRGEQIINVYYGGTLYQDIETYFGLPRAMHSPGDYQLLHDSVIEEGTLLAAILNAGHFGINSSHHQAVKDTKLTVAAKDPNGVIEAVELPGERFVLGVQWHPERLTDLRLFEALVRAASVK